MSWAEIGGDPEAFWRLTLAQINRHIAGVVRRRKADHDLAAWQSWTTANLVMIGFHKPAKFPDLKKILPQKSKPFRPMGAAEIRAKFAALGALFKKDK